MTNHLVIYFRKSFYLVDEINDKIRLFKSSGIINFFISKYADEKYKKIQTGDDGPSKLTVNHFIGIIQLWLFGLVISFVSFVVEIFAIKIRKSLRFVKNNKQEKPLMKKT